MTSTIAPPLFRNSSILRITHREVEIADGEHLVDEHHVGLRVDGDGEPSRASMPLLYERTGESMKSPIS